MACTGSQVTCQPRLKGSETRLRPRNLAPAAAGGAEDAAGLVRAHALQAAPVHAPRQVHHRPVVAPQRRPGDPPASLCTEQRNALRCPRLPVLHHQQTAIVSRQAALNSVGVFRLLQPPGPGVHTSHAAQRGEKAQAARTVPPPEVERAGEAVRHDAAAVGAEAAAEIAQAGRAGVPHALLTHPQPCGTVQKRSTQILQGGGMTGKRGVLED